MQPAKKINWRKKLCSFLFERFTCREGSAACSAAAPCRSDKVRIWQEKQAIRLKLASMKARKQERFTWSIRWCGGAWCPASPPPSITKSLSLSHLWKCLTEKTAHQIGPGKIPLRHNRHLLLIGGGFISNHRQVTALHIVGADHPKLAVNF